MSVWTGARLGPPGAHRLILLALGGFVACGGGEPAVDETPAAAPADTEPGRIVEDGVAVFLTEYRIDMPASIEAGAIELSITNQGVEDHNMVITRKGETGVVWETDGNVEPHMTLNGAIELAPGEYLVACTFAGHDTRGMFMDLEVRPAGN